MASGGFWSEGVGGCASSSFGLGGLGDGVVDATRLSGGPVSVCQK